MQMVTFITEIGLMTKLKVMGPILTWMEPYMSACGKKTNRTVKEKRLGQMVQFMRATIKWA
jgi:hypothetical protein